MKVTYAPATNCPVGQFVIEAETEQDRAILTSFTSDSLQRDGWHFWLHGSTYQCSHVTGETGRVVAFNFGYIRTPTLIRAVHRVGYFLLRWQTRLKRTVATMRRAG